MTTNVKSRNWENKVVDVRSILNMMYRLRFKPDGIIDGIFVYLALGFLCIITLAYFGGRKGDPLIYYLGPFTVILCVKILLDKIHKK